MLGLNPKKMAGMMKKMGIAQQPIDAKRVVIETGGGEIIIDEPSVMKVTMQGQETFQISGVIREEEKQQFSDEDVATVVDKTGASEEDVKKFLAENEGDIALAIIELGKE